MKKRLKFLVGFAFLVLLVTGCDNNSIQTMTCTRTMNQNNIQTSLKYVVNYHGNYVTRVKSVETIETDNFNILDTYKEQVETIYNSYKDVKYYEYNVEIVDNKLISTVDINYEKIDTDKLLEIDSSNGQLIKDGKIAVADIKTVYENLGAICKNG